MVNAVLVALLAIGASPAEQAKQAYDKALKYSNAGEYEAALPHFERAYELSNHRPSTIIALAQCERELKLYEKAIAHFKEYLALKPAPKDSDKIRETVALLEELHSEEVARRAKEEELERQREKEQADEKEVAATPPVAPPPAPPPPPTVQAAAAPPPAPAAESESLLESPVFWIVTGAVVAAAATGVALGVALRPEGELYGGTSGIVLEK